MFISKQLLLLLCFNVSTFVVYAQYGVKDGRYHQQTNDTGECLRRIPYHEALSLFNTTESHGVTGYGHSARPSWNSTYSNGWVTVSVCCDGYQRNPSTGRCDSFRNDCLNGCFGGSCVNGICTCGEGWYAIEGVCKPICRRQCQQNAYCFAPDVCECKIGWEQQSNGECRPVCPGGCVNGECTAPRLCTCAPGFIHNERQQRCDAVCEGGCPHGECTSPGICTCNQGYVNPQYDRESCIPDCGPQNCNGGRCISPGVCACQQGYRRDSTNNCLPECHNCPANAKCISPERCVCDAGFQMDYRNNRCVPTGNQQNQSPQDYDQQAGYGNNDCQRPCINGVCVGYNICSCNSGYVHDPQDSSRTHCIPSCTSGCPNGSCSGPNFCICKPGYVKDRSVKGSQRCVPRREY